MNNNHVHRFCDYFSFYDSNNGYLSNTKPRFKVIYNNEYNNLYSDIFFGTKGKTPFNFTITDDCIQSFNQIDIFLRKCMFQFFEKSNGIDLSQFDVFGFIEDGRMYFITGYSASNATQYSDVLESFKSFSALTWILFFFILLLIYSLLIISVKNLKEKRQRRVERRRLFFKIISHFMKQNSMEGISTSFNQIILILILFTTFFHFVYNCLVHTDMVVAYKPFTPRTYQDIIDNETAKIDFHRPTELFFLESAKSSPDRIFYDKIKHRNLGNMPKEYIEKYYGENNTILQKLIRSFANTLFGQQILFVLGADMAIDQIHVLCSINIHFNEGNITSRSDTKIHENIYPWISTDPETNPTMWVYLKRKGFKPHESITKRISWIRQAGIQEMGFKLLDNMGDTLIPALGYEKKNKEFQDCLRYSRTVKLYNVNYSDLSVKNMKFLFYLFWGLIFVSFIVLLYEGWKTLFISLLLRLLDSLERILVNNLK